MKILMCNSFHYLRGGAERCFIELSDLLRSHGHEVIPFSMQHERNLPSKYSPYFSSNIDYPATLRSGDIWSKADAVSRTIYSHEAKDKVAQLIDATRPDIAHVHGIAHETSPSILPVIKSAGIPIVQTLHDYKLLCPNTSFVSQGQVCERCKGHRYYNAVRYRCKRNSWSASLLAGLEMSIHKLLRIYEQNVDLFITPSEFLKTKVAEYGIRNPVVDIPNFIDGDKIEPCYEPGDYFVYAGRLVDIKGIWTLARAMKQVESSRLVIAGQGDAEPALREYVRSENLDNVEFVGHLDTETLVSLLRKAAFMVVPSEWYENYSMTVLEAFACGTPVIGSAIGGIPEQVRHGITGLLFEPGNVDQLVTHIHRLQENPEIAIEMGRNARRQIEEINNPNKHYELTMELYLELLRSVR